MAEIELHGWTEIILPTQAVFDLGSRALKVYCYLVFRERKKGYAWPGIARMAEDLNKTEDEDWSEPTVKRALAELAQKKYIYRQRRIGKSSITHVFKSPNDYREITDDPTVSSPVIQASDNGRSKRKSTKNKEYKDEAGAARRFDDTFAY